MDGEPSQAGRDSEVPHAEGEEHPDERRRLGRRPLIVLAGVVAVLVIAGGWYDLATRDHAPARPCGGRACAA